MRPRSQKVPTVKRPRSAWLFYWLECWQKMREQSGGADFVSATRAAAAQWKALADRAAYVEMARQDKARYVGQCEAMEESARPANWQRIAGLGVRKHSVCTGYLLFCVEAQRQFKHLTFAERGRALGQLWRGLEDEAKDQYRARAKHVKASDPAALAPPASHLPSSPAGGGSDFVLQ